MERASLHQLVILMAFSHLIVSSYAIPSTRSQRMLQNTLELRVFSDTHQKTIEQGTILDDVFSGRMDLGISNDYPGSGPNNRHTPKPPAGRKLLK